MTCVWVQPHRIAPPSPRILPKLLSIKARERGQKTTTCLKEGTQRCMRPLHGKPINTCTLPPEHVPHHPLHHSLYMSPTSPKPISHKTIVGRYRVYQRHRSELQLPLSTPSEPNISTTTSKWPSSSSRHTARATAKVNRPGPAKW